MNDGQAPPLRDGPQQTKSMLGALIIVFREVIEAGLIIGIVMAATRGVPTRGRWIGFGILGGVVGAALVAVFAGAISQAFEGAGQELFNASVLGIAVVMLMWHNAWMARHGREIAEEMRTIGSAVSEGAKPLTALAVVVGLEKVSVDGKPEALLRCNYLMRGVYLQPGPHAVEFRFAPPVNTLYVSLAAVFVGLLLIGYLVLAREKESAPGALPGHTTMSIWLLVCLKSIGAWTVGWLKSVLFMDTSILFFLV